GSVQALAFSPCGRYLASGGWCGSVCIWDLGTGHQVGQLGGHSAEQPRNEDASTASADSSQWLTGPVVTLAYNPDGSGRLAAGGLDGAVRIWDTSSGRQQRVGASSSTTTELSERPQSGLIAMHRATKQQISRGQSSQGQVNPNFVSYYSSVAGASVSDKCLREAFFTRRTSVLGLQVRRIIMLSVHPRKKTEFERVSEEPLFSGIRPETHATGKKLLPTGKGDYPG
ncbi:hypothetical protein X801_05105, partial [Opisthorchis viverrini]